MVCSASTAKGYIIHAVHFDGSHEELALFRTLEEDQGAKIDDIRLMLAGVPQDEIDATEDVSDHCRTALAELVEPANPVRVMHELTLASCIVSPWQVHAKCLVKLMHDGYPHRELHSLILLLVTAIHRWFSLPDPENLRWLRHEVFIRALTEHRMLREAKNSRD